MEYNEYPYEKIKQLIDKGQELSKEFSDEETLLMNHDFSMSEYRFVRIGFKNPDYVVPPVKTYYRIGQPRLDDGGCYKPSWNFAEERAEDGVSVVTVSWLHSFKSVFFNTTDEAIKKKGVYKIEGFKLPSSGGDDETLIVPLSLAECTRIRTRQGLERTVAKSEQER